MKKLISLLLFFSSSVFTTQAFASDSLYQIANIANNPNFQSRCYYAITVAAANVASEASSTAGHSIRIAYAQQVLNGNASAIAIARAVLTNATIAAEADVTQTSNAGYSIPDSDISFTVTSIFNALAGYDGN